MLVVIDRDSPTVAVEDVDALLEELVARVEDLAFGVVGIIAVLADDQHGIDSQLVAAAAQGLRDRRVDAETKAASPLAAEVAGRLLVDVRGDDLHVRLMPAPLLRIADKKPVTDMLRMRLVEPDSRHQRDAFGFGGAGGKRRRTEAGQRKGRAGRRQKFSARNHHVLQKVDSSPTR